MTAISSLLRIYDRVISAIENALMLAVVLVMLVVMVLVSADGLGRYLFNKPVYFTVDLVSHYLLPVLLLLPASFVFRRAGHISVDIFALALPQRLFRALIGLATAAVVPVIWVMSSRVLQSSIESFEMGQVTAGLIPWPLWAEKAVYAVGVGLLTARVIHVSLSNLWGAISKDDAAVVDMINHHESPLEEAI